MNVARLQKRILHHVRAANYRPVKSNELAGQLGLDDKDAGQLKQLKRAIKELVSQGQLDFGRGRTVALPNSGSGAQVTGIFRRTSGGFGFVRPAGTKPSEGKQHDIYIAEKHARDASNGDVVLVELQKEQRPNAPGPAGRIERVVERETHRFVGVYFEQGGVGLVDVDGKPFSHPILVGDPGAKGARPDDKVVIEMVRFPSHAHEGEAVLVEVLGHRGDPGVDVLSIIHEFGLPGDFSEESLQAARKEADNFEPQIGRNRTDLTKETVITIDPVDARDFDDAISLEKLDNGHWQLGVHIADVSHFVRAKSALDREARGRATSVYLPDRVIPMLPEIVSNNLASLQPNRVRYCLTAWIEMTADGVHVDTRLDKTAIKSKRRFTYEEVDDYLENPDAWKKKLKADVHRLLGHMHKLAMILRRRRLDAGALELNMPEVKIDLDKQGRVTGAHVVESTVSHQIIEEFMLAANEAVAGVLSDHNLHFLRRVHSAPDPKKLKALTEFVHELGLTTDSMESRFAIQDVLERVAQLPQKYAVNFAVLRSMQRAVYSPEEDGHYALAKDCYCHFTSPIRRYPDLTIHRLITAILARRRPTQDMGALLAMGEHCSERERRAESAERELTKVKLLTYMSTRIGDAMDGIVTGVEKFGLFIQGVEIPAEGFIHVSALADDYYRYEQRSHTLAGHRSGNCYRLGDAVRVAVARVDIDRRELDFRLVKRLGPAKAPKPSAPKKKRPPKKKARRRL